MKNKPARGKRTKRAKPSTRSKSAVQDSEINRQPEFAARVGARCCGPARALGGPLVCTAHRSTCWKMDASLLSVRERDARRTS